MNTLDLIRLHLELECIGMDAEDQLHRIPCTHPDTVPRVYAVRCDKGNLLFFRRDTPQTIRERIARMPFDKFFTHPDMVNRVMAAHSACMEIYIGRSYVFPTGLNDFLYPDVVRLSCIDRALVRRYDPELNLHQREVFGILVDGMVVSTCESSRENNAAGEAWVRTLEAYRRRGYARQVTLAWAHSLQQQGKVPFYSHNWENAASCAVAQSLRLVQYIEDAGYA